MDTRFCTAFLLITFFFTGSISPAAQGDELINACKATQIDLKKVRGLVETGSDLDRQNSGGNSALMYCAIGGHEDAVAVLLTAGANPNLVNKKGESALSFARKAKQRQIERRLLRSGAIDHWQWTYLELATSRGGRKWDTYQSWAEDMPRVRWRVIDEPKTPEAQAKHWLRETRKALSIFRRSGVDLDARDFEGRTLLHFLLGIGAPSDVIGMIIDAGASANALDSAGHTPLSALVSRKDARRSPAYLKILASAGGDIDGVTPSNEAVFSVLVRGAALVLRPGDTKRGERASIDYSPWIHFIKGMVENGADLRVRSLEGATLVMLAEHRDDVVAVLLEAGADIDAVDPEGRTALHRAVGRESRPHARTIAVLLEHGPSLNLKDKAGNGPIHLAIQNEKLDAAVAMIDAGADIESKNGDGDTPLCLAIRGRQYDFAARLIELGADVNLRGAGNRHPLSLLRTSPSRSKRLLELENVMVAAGAEYDESAEDKFKRTTFDRETGKFTKGGYSAGEATPSDSPSGSGENGSKRDQSPGISGEEESFSREGAGGEFKTETTDPPDQIVREVAEFISTGKGATADAARRDAFARVVFDVLSAAFQIQFDFPEIKVGFRRPQRAGWGNFSQLCDELSKCEVFAYEDLVPPAFVAPTDFDRQRGGVGEFEATIVYEMPPARAIEVLRCFGIALRSVHQDFSGSWGDPGPEITNIGIRFPVTGLGQSVEIAIENSISPAIEKIQVYVPPLLLPELDAARLQRLVTPSSFAAGGRAIVTNAGNLGFEQVGEQLKVTTEWVLDLQLLQDSAHALALGGAIVEGSDEPAIAETAHDVFSGDEVAGQEDGAVVTKAAAEQIAAEQAAAEKAAAARETALILSQIQSEAKSAISMMKNYAAISDCLQVGEYITLVLELDDRGVTEAHLWDSAQAAISCKAGRRRVLEAIVSRFPDGSRTRFAKMELELE